MTNLQTQVTELQTGFGAIQGIDPCSPSYERLITILDQADDEALQAIHAAKIKFVSKLAFNRMIRRGLVKMEG